MPTLFVSVGGAPVLFTLFVFVEEAPLQTQITYNKTRHTPTDTNKVTTTWALQQTQIRRAHVVFTLFVSVGVSLVLFYVICVCRGAPLLFTLFVNNVNKTRPLSTKTNNVNTTWPLLQIQITKIRQELPLQTQMGSFVLFTSFVSVGELLSYFTLFVFVRGAPFLFTLFVFVEELMSCLRYLGL
jgi:ABC-type phosphate transport system permease subunit